MSEWVTESFREQFERQAHIMGRFNLAIFGKTGVGKSTLVNAVFGEKVAETGIGEPVTQGSHLYLDRRGQLGIVDTQGLEVGKDNKALFGDLEKMVKDMRKKPVAEQVHVAWYCVRGMDRRFEEAEADFVRRLAELELPVIMVFTQVPRNADGLYHPDAVALARHIQSMNLPIVGGRPFMTNAMRDPFTGQPEHGLIDVLTATFQVAPEAVHGALAATQQIDLAAKAREAQKAVTTAAASAAAAAASPIPFSDAAMLVPIQLGMFARIAQVFGVRFERASMLALASTSAATAGGRAAFTNLLKMVPGAGTLTGGLISAGVASTFTLAMGQAWIVVCQRAQAGQLAGLDGALDSQAVQDLFQNEFRKRMPGVRREQ
ncbi:GTP-binding protein [Mariniluteicoccus endophyticus]